LAVIDAKLDKKEGKMASRAKYTPNCISQDIWKYKDVFIEDFQNELLPNQKVNY